MHVVFNTSETRASPARSLMDVMGILPAARQMAGVDRWRRMPPRSAHRSRERCRWPQRAQPFFAGVIGSTRRASAVSKAGRRSSTWQLVASQRRQLQLAPVVGLDRHHAMTGGGRARAQRILSVASGARSSTGYRIAEAPAGALADDGHGPAGWLRARSGVRRAGKADARGGVGADRGRARRGRCQLGSQA